MDKPDAARTPYKADQPGAPPRPPALSQHLLSELWADVLVERGFNYAQVVSDSMSPLIARGSRVLVEKAFWHDIRFADVIVFRSGEQFTVHRALTKSRIGGRPYLLEKGDSVLWPSAVPEEDLMGRIHYVEVTGRNIDILSGPGRVLQLVLGLQSYLALQLWRLVALALRILRQDPTRRRYAGVYNRLSTTLLAMTFRLLPLTSSAKGALPSVDSQQTIGATYGEGKP
jgi:signal peptidase I